MSYKYNLSIAACFKNELPFLEEWIKYHLFIGIQHFYLANNDYYKTPANKLLLPYIKKGLVTVIPDCNLRGQIKIMPELINLTKYQTRWLAVIDIDEFIYPQKQNCDIYNEIIRNYEKPNIAGIGLNWAIFGTGNYVFHQNLVTQSYFKRAFKEDAFNKTIKLIVRPEHVTNIRGHALFCDNKIIVNTLSELIEPKELKYKTEVVVWDHLRLNHYPLKSLEDFMNKAKFPYMGKGYTVDNNQFWSQYFADFNKNDQKDMGMLFIKDQLV